MKIAILYGGRILDYDTYYDKLKKFIIKDNDVDIFLSHSKELNEDLTGFIDLYKPKIVIDENIDYNGTTPQHYNGMCMFYNRYRIFQAFKKYCQKYEIRYDIIMVYRLDVLALSEIDFNTMDLIDDNSIYVPNIANCKGINDFMAIGNFNAIEKYCHLMLHYEEILTQCYVKDSNELILKVYLDTIKMKINYFPYNCLLREDIRLNGGRNVRISKEDLKNLLKNDIKF